MGKHDGALKGAELVFQYMAAPNDDGIKRLICIRYLETFGEPEFYADCPREAAAVVTAALAHGATWTQIAQAGQIDVAEAQRLWGGGASGPRR